MPAWSRSPSHGRNTVKPTLVEGIDIGLVDTGVVSMLFVPEVRNLIVRHKAVAGPDEKAVANWLRANRPVTAGVPFTFAEAYNPRVKLNTDKRMVEAMQRLKVELPRAKVIPNTAIKKIVKRELMELMGIWRFTTPTRHQDLRSAARIAVLGMLKDDDLNALVTKVVTDHLEGNTWNVDSR